MILGSCIEPEVLEELGKLGEFAAVVTDPPYASGAAHSAGRKAPPTSKYKQTETRRQYLDFLGDAMDQRSWTRWSAGWLEGLRRLSRTEAYVMVFSDWRQLPSVSDALQWSNWTWRGVSVWDKTEGSRAPNKSYFRHQAEFIVWGSNGRLSPSFEPGRRTVPGVFRASIDSRKVHLCQKPVAVMSWLLSILPERDGWIVDPFAGSGSTLLAAEAAGISCAGVELHEEIALQALERLEGEGFRVEAT
ncbi:MAG: site-specific DNA-methyltransferase [Acidobacteria bacterium]|nr:site-specific DNA-methyltransferase [Acidobacteriota bacterium]